MISQSESIAALAAALAKCQSEMANPKRGSENPFFKSKYADLAAVLGAVTPVLSKHGLSVSQHPCSETGETVSVVTVLAHESGEWISSSLTLRPVKADPQGIGSAITYARRYALQAVAGVAAEDDDGNAASVPSEQPTRKSDLVESPPAPSDGQTYVAKVESKTGQGKKGTWTRYTVTLSDGQYGSTFDQKLATACEQYRDRQTPVTAEFEQDGKFTNIVSCQSAASTYVVERVAGKAGPDGIERPPFRLFVKGDSKIYLTEDASIADEANELAGKGTFAWRNVEKTIDTADGERTIYYVEDVRSVPF